MDQTYTEECDVCGGQVPATDTKTVEWANVIFCSTHCRLKWQNHQVQWI